MRIFRGNFASSFGEQTTVCLRVKALWAVSILWWDFQVTDFFAAVVVVLRKDVRLPRNLQRAMAAEAEASREARAKVRSNSFRRMSI